MKRWTCDVHVHLKYVIKKKGSQWTLRQINTVNNWLLLHLCKICFLQFVFKFISNVLSRSNYFYKTYTTNTKKKNVRTVLWSIVLHLQQVSYTCGWNTCDSQWKKEREREAPSDDYPWRNFCLRSVSLFFLFVEIDETQETRTSKPVKLSIK